MEEPRAAQLARSTQIKSAYQSLWALRITATASEQISNKSKESLFWFIAHFRLFQGVAEELNEKKL